METGASPSTGSSVRVEQLPYPHGLLNSYWDLGRRYDPADVVRQFKSAGLNVPRLVIDSGVYTARQKGVQIGIKEYTAWLASKDWGHALHAAIDIDWPPDQSIVRRHTAAIRMTVGAERTWPVLHTYMSDRDLEEVCDSYPWCAAGAYGTGLVTNQLREMISNRAARESRLRWYEKLHGIAAKHGTKLHALGTGATNEILRRFDWASADASLISTVGRYGVVFIWDDNELHCHLGGTKARSKKVTRHHADGTHTEFSRPGGRTFNAERISALFAKYRIPIQRVLDDKDYRAGVSAAHIARMEHHYNARNSKGFVFFMADKNIGRVVGAYRHALGAAARCGEYGPAHVGNH